MILAVECTPMLHPHNQYDGAERGNIAKKLWGDLARRRERTPNPCQRNKWASVLFGQLIALVAASQNAASFTLEYGLGNFFPLFLMFNAYVALSCHLWWNWSLPEEVAPHKIPYTSIRLRTPWWYYFCLSVLDVGPNYLTLLSLKHTSLTSATLLGSLTVPSTMVVCGFLLAKVYRPKQYLGVVLCMTGGMLTIWTDLDKNGGQAGSTSHPHSYYGDMLAVVAALLYGINDAAGEFWSKHVDRKEYLGMLGFFGTAITLILFPLLERKAVIDLFADASTLLPALSLMLLYVPFLVTYYVSATLFLVSSDATFLNLSLQTSNLWAILFSVLAFQESPPALFYVAVVLVVSGVFVYELVGTSYEEQAKPTLRLPPKRADVKTSYKTMETNL